MTNPDRNAHSLAKTLARYPVSGRSWRLVFFGSGSDSPALEPYHDELGREEMRRLAQQVAKINNRLQELDAAQTELFLQARDLYGRLADIAPKLGHLEQQISEMRRAQQGVRDAPLSSDPTAAAVHASPTVTEEWISVRDAARILGVAPSTIRRYVARGLLESRRLPTGRGLRLLRSQVERLLIAPSDAVTPPPSRTERGSCQPQDVSRNSCQ